MDDNPAIAFLMTHLSARAAELSLPCSINDSSQADIWVRAAEAHAAHALNRLPDTSGDSPDLVEPLMRALKEFKQ